MAHAHGERMTSAPMWPRVPVMTRSWAKASAQIITLTAVATGTAANAYTLSAAPNVSGKLAVSGATLSGGVNGDQAVYKVLAWTEGTFEIDFSRSSSEHTTTRSTQGLLMEGLRLIDEANRDAEENVLEA